MSATKDFEAGMYFERGEAESAVERLHTLGYDAEDISVVMDDKTREKAFANEVGAKTNEGVATGAAAGGLLGALVAGLTATGGISAIVGSAGAATPIVIGPIAAAFAGLGAGGAIGGILGGFIGLGIGEQRARQYEQGLRQGGILIAVRPKSGNHDRLREALRDRYAADYAGETGPGR